MWTAALVSAVLRTKLAGPGTIYLEQDLKFLKPVSPDDTTTVTVRVKEGKSTLPGLALLSEMAGGSAPSLSAEPKTGLVLSLRTGGTA
jgi:acyl dehydratase